LQRETLIFSSLSFSSTEGILFLRWNFLDFLKGGEVVEPIFEHMYFRLDLLKGEFDLEKPVSALHETIVEFR
jgi:hypothetical protein